MATKLGRVLQKVFGINCPTGGIGVGQMSRFGSFAAGASTTETPNDAGALDLQSLAAWSDGWQTAVQGGNSPVIEDFNATHFLFSRQLAYLLQQGVAEYDSTTTYFKGSIAQDGTGFCYVCINDSAGVGISGQALTNTTYWAQLVPITVDNSLLNGFFDWWQRGTSLTLPYSTSAIVYGPDRWSGFNAVGAGGVITLAQVAGAVSGSTYGLKATVTTAPGVGGTTGAKVFHWLDVLESQKFLKAGAASFAVQVKAQGNVTGVQIGFVTSIPGYAGTPAVITNLQSFTAQSFTVNSAGFVQCVVNTNGISPFQLTNTILGISISVTTVSSGNASDLGNGFILEQAMLNPGMILAAVKRAFNQGDTEVQALQKYFEKSYDLTTAPGTATFSGAWGWYAQTASEAARDIDFAARKRVSGHAAIMTYYNGNTGSTTNPVHDATAAADYAAAGGTPSERRSSFSAAAYAGAAGNGLTVQWTADAEIY